MFNKYFKPSEVTTKITIRFRVNYHVIDRDGDDELSEDPYSNWRDFTNRDGGVSSNLIHGILKSHITTLSDDASFYWNSLYHPDQHYGYIEVQVEKIEIPEPSVTKCQVQGCPYSNYFGVCRNCEDKPLAIPDQAAIEEHQRLYARFIEEIEAVEKLPFLTVNEPTTMKGYIADIGEIEARVTPF